MEDFKIKIISTEVAKKIDKLDNVITHIIWQYILDSNGIKESLCFRTALEPPVKKSFIKLDKIVKDTLIEWVKADIEFQTYTDQLIEYHGQKENPTSFIFTPKN